MQGGDDVIRTTIEHLDVRHPLPIPRLRSHSTTPFLDSRIPNSISVSDSVSVCSATKTIETLDSTYL